MHMCCYAQGEAHRFIVFLFAGLSVYVQIICKRLFEIIYFPLPVSACLLCPLAPSLNLTVQFAPYYIIYLTQSLCLV